MKKTGVLYAVAIGLVILNSPSAYVRVFPYLKNNNEIQSLYMDEVALMEDTTKPGDRVFVVTKENSLKDGFYLQYFMNDRTLNYGLNYWPTNNMAFYENNVASVIDGYDYLMILTEDADFDKNYCDTIKTCPDIASGMYRINKDHDGNVVSYELVQKLNN